MMLLGRIIGILLLPIFFPIYLIGFVVGLLASAAYGGYSYSDDFLAWIARCFIKRKWDQKCQSR